jgi:hypothetical protein
MSVIVDVERHHRPRARLRAAVPVQIENDLPVLPELVLWALALDEGDLLTVEPDHGGFRFRSYLADLGSILESIGDPWTYLKPMLRLPMAVVGPQHILLLPEEAAELVEHQGGSLVLYADGREHAGSDSFVLQVKEQPPSPLILSVKKEYTLSILPGSRVILPDEALWLTGLRGGGRLACKAALGIADFEPAAQVGHLEGRFWVDLEPDGTLLLPESLRNDAENKPYDCVLLTINSPRFQLRLWVEWGAEGALQRLEGGASRD